MANPDGVPSATRISCRCSNPECPDHGKRLQRSSASWKKTPCGRCASAVELMPPAGERDAQPKADPAMPEPTPAYKPMLPPARAAGFQNLHAMAEELKFSTVATVALRSYSRLDTWQVVERVVEAWASGALVAAEPEPLRVAK